MTNKNRKRARLNEMMISICNRRGKLIFLKDNLIDTLTKKIFGTFFAVTKILNSILTKETEPKADLL